MKAGQASYSYHIKYVIFFIEKIPMFHFKVSSNATSCRFCFPYSIIGPRRRTKFEMGISYFVESIIYYVNVIIWYCISKRLKIYYFRPYFGTVMYPRFENLNMWSFLIVFPQFQLKFYIDNEIEPVEIS